MEKQLLAQQEQMKAQQEQHVQEQTKSRNKVAELEALVSNLAHSTVHMELHETHRSTLPSTTIMPKSIAKAEFRSQQPSTLMEGTGARIHPTKASTCTWLKGYKGDHKDCTLHRMGPSMCKNKKHGNHAWTLIHCKAMCYPECKRKTGCPYDLSKFKEHKDCSPERCNPNNVLYHWATVQCKKTCNPDCNLKVVHLDYSSPNFVPSATLSPGHRYCADKYTVRTKEGYTKNSATGKSQAGEVCGKCKNRNYVLHPAYVVGNRVLGVCAKMTEHPLWHEANKQCNDKKKPCKGEKFRKCQEFMGDWGRYRDDNTGLQYVDDGSKPQEGRAMAFTCARASAYDFSDAAAISRPTNGHCTANVHRIVQISFVSCYSTNEEEQPRQQMECVTKKVTRACYHRKLTMPKADSQAKCQQSYAADKVVVFAELNKNGPAKWGNCSEMAEKEGSALA